VLRIYHLRKCHKGGELGQLLWLFYIVKIVSFDKMIFIVHCSSLFRRLCLLLSGIFDFLFDFFAIPCFNSITCFCGEAGINRIIRDSIGGRHTFSNTGLDGPDPVLPSAFYLHNPLPLFSLVPVAHDTGPSLCYSNILKPRTANLL